jgi:hypothetical protein
MLVLYITTRRKTDDVQMALSDRDPRSSVRRGVHAGDGRIALRGRGQRRILLCIIGTPHTGGRGWCVWTRVERKHGSMAWQEN